MSHSLLHKLAIADKTSRVAVSDTAKVTRDTPLSAVAQTLPPHIIAATDAQKLNTQTPYFKCPVWADLPSTPYHLYCTREGVPLPALALHRFPFYLLGKSPVCDYVLEHPSVSALHAAMIFHKSQACFVLLDLGSSNGVKVDGVRIERQKPIAVPVGKTIQLGYSTRIYEVRAGVPPSSKRLREEQEELRQLKKKEAQGEVTSSPAAACAGAQAKSSRDVMTASPEVARAAVVNGEPPPSSSLPLHNDSTPIAGTSGPSPPAPDTAGTAPVEEAPREPRKLHLFHIVIKHKDLENAVSRGRTKGEVITRALPDAVQIAEHILRVHDREAAAPTSGGFVPWTVEEFVTAVLEYSEVSTKKKGDLGTVEEGALSDAFDKAAFALRRHEVSRPVTTPMGVHLIYRCD